MNCKIHSTFTANSIGECMVKGVELPSTAQGSLNGPRYSITVNQTEGQMILDLLKDGTPLFSSNPACPVIGYQIYKDDGNG